MRLLRKVQDGIFFGVVGVCDTPNTEKMTNRCKKRMDSMSIRFFYLVYPCFAKCKQKIMEENCTYVPVPLSKAYYFSMGNLSIFLTAYFKICKASLALMPSDPSTSAAFC